MSSFLNWGIVLGLAVTIAGAALYIGKPVVDVPPPKTPAAQIRAEAAPLAPFPDVGLLSAPWYRPSPPVRASAAPAPAPTAAPVTLPDTNSLVFLGTYSEKDGSIAYFFKDKRNSQVLILKPGQPFKGWTLDDIRTKAFALTGPGGHYEVAR
jgi:hypothetical protein